MGDPSGDKYSVVSSASMGGRHQEADMLVTDQLVSRKTMSPGTREI